ncbi:hypothetical protein [Ectopseudomonas hydrolytica]|uniref:hypothetical protein n=1 Tax=Ectopseudomonas hydrolytica TaxID=2493633 RepID=UPI00376EC8C9
MSEQKKMDDRAAFEAYMLGREHPTFGWISSHWFGRGDDPATYENEYVQGCWVMWQARASLPVGVPDGYALLTRLAEWCDKQPKQPWYGRTAGDMVRTFMACQPLAAPAAQPAAELTNVQCQCCAAEYSHDSYDAGFIAGSGMCQACDAAMPPKDLPAAEQSPTDKESLTVAEQSAPGEVEEVEVVGYRFFHVDHGYIFRRTHIYEGNPSLEAHSLMTVAQHKRLMAAEIQKRFDGNEQSSREHREELAQLAARDAGEVRVPVELLQRCASRLHNMMQADLEAELRALLAQRERGEA